MSMERNNLVEALSSLTVVEVCDLVKELEAKWGVSAAPRVQISSGVESSSNQSAAPVAEKTEFDVSISDVGTDKIKVIKEVRTITGLGLAESKALVEADVRILKTSIKKDEAMEIKSKLEAVGAKVEIK